jgi:hypothetical protein
LALLAIFAQASDGPCEDRRYKKLMKKDLTRMSDEDYEYLDRHDKECKAYLNRVLSGDKVLSEPTSPSAAYQPAPAPANEIAPEPPPVPAAEIVQDVPTTVVIQETSPPAFVVSPEPPPSFQAPAAAPVYVPAVRADPVSAPAPYAFPKAKVYGPEVAPAPVAMSRRAWHPPMIVPIPKPMPPEYARPVFPESDPEKEKEYIRTFARILGLTAGAGLTIFLIASFKE